MSSFGRNIAPIIMLLASVWALFGFLRPQYDSIQLLREEKQRYEKAVNDANEIRILRSTLLATYDSISPVEWERLSKLLPDKVDGVRIAMDVNGLASAFGITMSGFSVNEIKDSAPAPASSISGPPVAGDSQVSSGSASGGQSSSEVVVQETPPPPQSGIIEMTTDVTSEYLNFMSFLRELEKHIKLIDVAALSVASAKDPTKDTPGVYQFKLKLHTYWLR